MARTSFYLDNRHQKTNGTLPLKMLITHRSKNIMLSLDVYLLDSQWDKANAKVVNHPRKQFINSFLSNRKTIADSAILKLSVQDKLDSMVVADLKKHILAAFNNEDMDADNNGSEQVYFMARLEQFADMKKKGTKGVYMLTYRRIIDYLGEDDAKRLKFEDINKGWLTKFDNWLALSAASQNYRNIHMRNIRAVFNDALDEELITCYPFRRFKLKYTQTAKRSLSVEQLREYFSAPCLGHQQQYLDVFKLTFFLIGINLVDLSHLKRITNGRIEYNRAKTNRLYSIKVEPEAMEIIEKYRGEKWLLNILDRYKNYADFGRRLNSNLKEIGNTTIGKQGKMIHQPLQPELSIYWARHTWATVAAELDIPKETIAAALGHGGNTVTDIYIRFDDKKIDAANRKVIDYVLYGE